jgi:uncharacterized 2Fe-2S/4Fe-4S cluster protein (DUF4445 family)
MGITHGMQAAPGAIEMVWSDGKFLTMRTIDDAPARGICGSGLIDIMACLVQLGGVDPSGRLKNPHRDPGVSNLLRDRYELRDGIASLRLVEDLYFTQKDIRQFQLAKSAVQTGIDMLLSAAGADIDQLDKIVIGGAFGHHLREESLRKTGMIPARFKGIVEFAGNTSRVGSALLLTDAPNREFLAEATRQLTYYSLAAEKEFQSRFINNMSLGSFTETWPAGDRLPGQSSD